MIKNSIDDEVNMDSDDAMIRHQAITNTDQVLWHHMVSSEAKELKYN